MFRRIIALSFVVAVLCGCATKPYSGPREQDPVWVNNTVQEVAVDLREDGELDRKWKPWVSEETKSIILKRAQELNRNHVGE